MAEIFGVKLKNVKFHKDMITARIDMDGTPIGSFMKNESGCFASVDYNIKQLGGEVHLLMNEVNNADVERARKKDSANAEKLDKAISDYSLFLKESNNPENSDIAEMMRAAEGFGLDMYSNNLNTFFCDLLKLFYYEHLYHKYGTVAVLTDKNTKQETVLVSYDEKRLRKQTDCTLKIYNANDFAIRRKEG